MNEAIINDEKQLDNENKTLNEVKQDNTIETKNQIKCQKKSLDDSLPNLRRGIVEDDELLPNMPPTEIRIFLASTFRDFSMERDYILQYVYDELRQFCLEKFQRDFILIDLRWGVTDEWCDAVSKQKDTEACLYEVEKNRTDSIGPNFVAFLSHQYGSILTKLNIETSEFELIREHAKEVTFEGKNLLEFAYELDKNCKDKQFYKLKSTEKITNELKIAKEKWWDVGEKKLKKLIQDTVKKIMKRKKKYEEINFDEERKESYCTSVTHQEIIKGLINEEKPDRKCVAFFRDIIYLKEYGFKTKDYEDYMDDAEKQRMEKLRKLVEEKLPKNKIYFELDWTKANNFEDPHTKEIDGYLKKFGEQFKLYMMFLVEQNIDALEQKNKENIELQKRNAFNLELLHHALFCNRLVKPLKKDVKFREGLTNKIINYLNDEHNNRPFIVTGNAGTGKSTILAYTIKNLRKERDVFIFRFLGTSKASSTMKNVILSILEQLDDIYGKSEASKSEQKNVESDKENNKIRKSTRIKSIPTKIKSHRITAKSDFQDMDSKRQKLEILDEFEEEYPSDMSTSSSSDEDEEQEEGDEVEKEEETLQKKEPFDSNLELKYEFKERLEKLSKENKIEKRLVIVLDSLDQLSKYDSELDWFLSELPKNVKMIYSVISSKVDEKTQPDSDNKAESNECNAILNKIKRILTIENNYLNMDKLSITEAQKMLQALLDTSKRQLTGSQNDTVNEDTQWFHINKVFQNTDEIYPLHVKILFDIAKTWISSFKVDEKFSSCICTTQTKVEDCICTKETRFSTCISTNDTIKYLYEKFEGLHGEILFSRCVFYLSLFEYNGISESEIEDILSIDDDVLTAVFERFHPPVRRFPIAIWLKIKYELKDYITNKENDGVSVISWFHRSFVEAAEEKYKDMFESSVKKDNLLMNVIDYFIETYNRLKSDGTEGIKKRFIFNSKKEKKANEKMQKRKDLIVDETGSENVYADFRNTRSQKMKLTLKRSTELKNKKEPNARDETVFYNKRKLNELVNIISKLSNSTKKVELLKEYVYFNYEFMLAKCELRNFDFVFETHPLLLKLEEMFDNDEIHELVEISEIYKRKNQWLFNNSELLNIEVMSRLKSQRSKFTKLFSKNSGLHLVSEGYLKDRLRDLYIINPKWKFTKLHVEDEGPFIFVESVVKVGPENSSTILHVIDSKTAMPIGYIDLIKKALCCQIIIHNYDKTKDVTRVSNIDGLIYYSDGDKIYITSFLREFRPLQKEDKEKEFSDKIIHFFLLNSKTILVILKTSLVFQAIDGNKCVDEEQKFDVGGNIQIFESTIPKNVVFSPTFLDDCVDKITFIIGLEDTKILKIYIFDNKRNTAEFFYEIDSLKWNYFGADETCKQSLIIQDAFMIDKRVHYPQDDSIIIRFMLQEARIIDGNNNEPSIATLVEVKSNKSIDTLKLYENDFDIDDSIKYTINYRCDHVFLEAFIDRLVIIKLKYDLFQWLVCYTDFVTGKTIKRKLGHWKDEILNINFMRETEKLLVGQQRNGLRFFEIDENEIKDLSKVSTTQTDNDITKFNAIQAVKDKMLIRIDPEDDSTIKQIEYLQLSDDSRGKGINVHNEGIVYRLDENLLFVRIEREIDEVEQFELRVFDINKNMTIDPPLVINEPMKILLCNSQYIVLYGFKNKHIKVYKFNKMVEKDSFEFITETDTQKEVSQTNISLLKGCFDDQKNPRGFIQMMYNESEKKIELRHLNENSENKMDEIKKTELKLNGIELEYIETDYVITPLSKFLILYDKWKRVIYYVDYENNEVKHQVTIEGENEHEHVDSLEPTIHCVGNTDNLILHSLRKIHFIQFNNRDETFTQMVLKEYNSFRFSVFLEQNHLFVRMKDYKYMEIYKTDNLEVNQKDDSVFNQPMFINKRFRNDKPVPIHIDEKHLIIGTDDNELCVYEIEKEKKRLKELASLKLNGTITSLVFHKTFRENREGYELIVGVNSELLKFELIQ